MTPRLPLLAAGALALAACAHAPPPRGALDTLADAGDPVIAAHGDALRASPEAARAATDVLLAEPLDAERALRLGLLNSPALRASLARYGVAEAEAIQAGLLRNPGISLETLRAEGGGRWMLDLGLSLSLADALLRGPRRAQAESARAAAQLAVADALQDYAADVGADMVRAVRASHRAAVMTVAAEAADASADLADRFREAGNLTEREQRSERGEAEEQGLALTEAEAEARAARSRLAERLGLTAADAERLRLPAMLAAPADERFAVDALAGEALERRLDLQRARAREAIANRALAVAARRRGGRDVEIGALAEREFDGAWGYGAELAVELPVFDDGRTRVARAEAALTAATQERLALERAIPLQVARAVDAVETARARALGLRDRVLPARARVVELARREYNFMLIGVFELLLAKRAELGTYLELVDALGEYWLARNALERRTGVPLPLSAAAATLAAPAASTTDGSDAHEGHDAHQGHGAHQDHDPHSGHEGHGMREGHDAHEGHDTHRHHDGAARPHSPNSGDAP